MFTILFQLTHSYQSWHSSPLLAAMTSEGVVIVIYIRTRHFKFNDVAAVAVIRARQWQQIVSMEVIKAQLRQKWR